MRHVLLFLQPDRLPRVAAAVGRCNHSSAFVVRHCPFLTATSESPAAAVRVRLSCPSTARVGERSETLSGARTQIDKAQLNATNPAALRRALEELGYAEGRNLVLDYRTADGNAALYPSLVAETIGRNPDLIILFALRPIRIRWYARWSWSGDRISESLYPTTAPLWLGP
jgi:hypothetical protein